MTSLGEMAKLALDSVSGLSLSDHIVLGVVAFVADLLACGLALVLFVRWQERQDAKWRAAHAVQLPPDPRLPAEAKLDTEPPPAPAYERLGRVLDHRARRLSSDPPKGAA